VSRWATYRYVPACRLRLRMLDRTQSRVLFLGLAVFAGFAGAQALSGLNRGFRHERSADINNTFLDFAFAGRVEVDDSPVACLYRIPVLNIKRLIRPVPVTREIYVDQFRIVAFTSRDRDGLTAFEKRLPLPVSFPSPDAKVETQAGPIEFSIPKLALPPASYVALALVGTEVLRHHLAPLGPDPWERRAAWPMVVPANRRGAEGAFADAPNQVPPAPVIDWKTPSDPNDSCSSVRIH
jgi:hypothetical protein